MGSAPILLGLIYLIVCFLAGNVWFDFKMLVTLILIEFIYDMLILAFKKFPDKVKTDDDDE